MPGARVSTGASGDEEIDNSCVFRELTFWARQGSQTVTNRNRGQVVRKESSRDGVSQAEGPASCEDPEVGVGMPDEGHQESPCGLK